MEGSKTSHSITPGSELQATTRIPGTAITATKPDFAGAAPTRYAYKMDAIAIAEAPLFRIEYTPTIGELVKVNLLTFRSKRRRKLAINLLYVAALTVLAIWPIREFPQSRFVCGILVLQASPNKRLCLFFSRPACGPRPTGSNAQSAI